MRTIAIALALLFVASPAFASGHSCVEQSDVVGEELCSRYGDRWSIEREFPFTFRFGFRYAEFGARGHTFRETFKQGQRPHGYVGYRYPGDALGTNLTAGGADGGVTVFLVGQLYIGLDAGVLLGSARTQPVATSTYALTNDTGVNVFLFHAGAPIGYRIPLGRASLRAETLFGGTIADVSQRATAVSGATRSEVRSADATVGLIETRAAADIWFTQHISFGAYAGVNLLDTTGRAFGLTLSFHGRSFDGDATLW